MSDTGTGTGCSGYDEQGRPMYQDTADGPQCARCRRMNGDHETGCPNA